MTLELLASSPSVQDFPFLFQVNQGIESQKYPLPSIRQRVIRKSLHTYSCYRNVRIGHLAFSLLLLTLTSGVRFGDCVGLTRDDFDFNNNLLHIKRTWEYKEGTGFTATINISSERVIIIDQDTLNAFKKLFEETPTNFYNLVFFSPSYDTKVLSNAAVNKSLRIILDDLRLKHITVHGLKHTHASILLYKGISIYFVSERLGHRTVDTTMSHYAHVLNELRAKDTLNTVATFTEMKKGLE